MLKLFYKWLLGNDDVYPEIIRWLKPKYEPYGKVITRSEIKETVERLFNNSARNFDQKSTIGSLDQPNIGEKSITKTGENSPATSKK